MRILEYSGLDTSRVREQYRKVCEALARGDWRSAEVKKLSNLAHGKFYRARLDYANRLLFTLLRHGEETCALALEVIEQHAYERSRFLKGAVVEEDRIQAVEPAEARLDAAPLPYLHRKRREIHYLDKPLSFDDAQEAVYRIAPPLVLVGGAGSGKTALALEKLKHAEGEVLYVTHSGYLAQSARELYYAAGFEREGQEAEFLSYREFVETLHVPPGREASWRDFSGWFARQQQAFRGVDSHQAFEEIRGVIAAQPGGVLNREAYLALGVRQSIFAAEERSRLYDLFERYRAWLAEAKLYDLGLVAQDWLPRAAPRYDFLVIDEAQDLTPAQLLLVLRTLKHPERFLLCGDSNQIVHPNFFSWSQVKTLFWRDEAIAARQDLRILRANFRNGEEATRVANTLLKVKHRRFGSIDRESNFLVEAVGADAGSVTLVADREAAKRALNEQTRRSARFAVLVLREEQKAEARRYFQTPLVFAIHEAKGLEYENVVLYRFVSDQRAQFAEVAAGVALDDLEGGDLEYRRARDKSDKSLEIYKFYVNALYVALTRAVRNVYLIESDLDHALLKLLGLAAAAESVRVEARTSSHEEWQKEARRLELQGKQEQAEAIRATILKETPVPWPVFDEARLRETLIRVFRERAPGGKARQQLHEYATCHDDPQLARWLAEVAGHDAARRFDAQRGSLGRKHYMPYFSRNAREVLQQCERHGLEHRTPMNQTPLMAAAAAGNAALAEALLERGADPEASDHLGLNALHWAMREAFRDAAFARGAFAALYERIAPAAIDVMAGERLVRLDRHLSEYFLFQTLWVLFKQSFAAREWRARGGFDTAAVLKAWEHMPASVLRPERKRREHLSGVLARNEIGREYAYNRRLFKRIGHGWYQFNPALAVRRQSKGEESWTPLFAALNLPLVHELSHPRHWSLAESLWRTATGGELGVPIAGEAWMKRREEELATARALEGALDPSPPPGPAPWGTREAREAEIERLRAAIAAKRRAEEQEDR
ncbi:MAG: AAA family ATPase [Betaproteobacteria bacterium]|nr:AAA family ATPase [Betaproteobacteria bacterium]